MKRRAFLQAIGVAVPVANSACSTGGRTALDRELLIALGEAVLPSELGAEGTRRVVGDFEAWVTAYREGAELLHGYGEAEITHAAQHPGEAWTGQLAALGQSAIDRFGTAFADVDADSRRTLIAAALENESRASLPAPQNAEHVAVALLSHFYRSAEAANLCYGARIDPLACRPLSVVQDRPEPL